MDRRRVLLALLPLVLACATPYQKTGFRGGFEDYPMGSDIFVVAFQGNAYTGRDRAMMMLHYRCAELTVENGGVAFAVLDGSNTDAYAYFTTPGQATTTTTATVTPVGRSATVNATSQTTLTPAQVHTFVKPGRSVVMRLFRDPPPPGVFDAKEVMRLLGPRIGVQPEP